MGPGRHQHGHVPRRAAPTRPRRGPDPPGAIELRFEGADRGTPRGRTEQIAYERSLTVAEALAGDALLVHEQNGEPLTAEHGGPVRLVVPGWYGMASVKWLRRIELIDHALEAHYQTRQYRYYRDEPVGTPGAPPVTAMRVNSLISSPVSGDVVDPGDHEIRGAAWAGASPIATVEVSVERGRGSRPSSSASRSPSPGAAGGFAVVRGDRWTPLDPVAGDRRRRFGPARPARLEPARLRQQRGPAHARDDPRAGLIAADRDRARGSNCPRLAGSASARDRPAVAQSRHARLACPRRRASPGS
jgi:DMSO/TMAO reductase YedYZ molybdopterin-dependent catalytic subunit